MTSSTTDSAPVVSVLGALPADLVTEVVDLVDAATEADGVRPLSEHVSLHLKHGGEGPDRHILLFAPDADTDADTDAEADNGGGHRAGTPRVAGYAHLDPTDIVAGSAVELVAHPAYRGHGYGRLLLSAAAEQAPDRRLRLWAHGDYPAARALAASLGFREGRRLEQWRRSLFSPLPRVELPDGVRLRAFRPGQDDDAWLELNARTFAGHPEQGSWTADDLHVRMGEAWFDPDGFLLAEENGRLVAFHWTKVHGGSGPTGADGRHAHDPIGEVYVVGVAPDHQGRGLGRAVTIAGLIRLRSQGLPQAMLYVESDNHAARATYRRLGFTHWDTDVMFYRESTGEPPRH
ncbi:MAG TPA: mycothiol synthase [Kineosporiaceae bacterium]|nr:mycothiol synthase [Kineosporiaceae bacterium]